MFGGFGSTGFGQQPQPQQQQQQQQQPSSLFGQTTNPQPGFGGFGATAAPTAFGQQTTNTGAFGQPSTSASPFGATTSTGFGTSGTSAFGAQRPFGSTGLFTGPTPASTAASSGFGFGSSTATAPAFGSTPSATGGLFGSRPAQNSAFGTTTNTGVFGQAAPTTSAFGSSNTSAFPATNTLPAGTSNPPYSVTNERDQATGTNNAFHSISAMPAYKNYSFEELRLQDYQQGRKTASGTSTGFGTTSGVFGATSTGSAFGQAAPATSTSLFGTSATPFGQTQPQTGFGQTGTTGFGASTGTTGGLFGSSTGTSTGMFGSSTQTQQPTSAFGGTGAFGTSGTAFGSTGGAFGAQAAKPTSFGFGSTSTTQPTTAFGATTPAFGQTGPTTTGNMFGTTTNPSGAFGATTQPGSSFGFGQSVPTSQPAATSFGGFSAQPTQQKPPASFSFGGSTPAPATGSFGGLGTQQPQTSKPTFSFGSGSATTFGTAPQTSGFLGQTSTAAPATGLTFGATPAQSTAFGTAAAPTTSFGSTLFSSKATAPLAGGLFSGTPAPQPSAFSFGTQPAATTAFPPLGQNTLLSSTSQTQQASIAASIDKNPYGNNPLFDGASTGATTTPPSATIVASAGKKKPAMTPHFKIAARSTAKVRLRGFGTSSSPLNGSATSNGLGRSLHFFDGVNDDSVLSPDTLVPRQSVKKLVIDRCINEEEILTSVDASNISDSPFVVSNGKGKAPASSTRPRVTFNPNLEVAAAETFYLSTPSSSVTYGSTNVTPIKRLDLTATSPDISASTPSPVNGILSAEGEYWTSPTLESLRRLSPEELAQVKDFRVGLTGYGQISFVAPVDLTGVASLRAVAGNIVIFERRACTVYPDEATKPPRGQGLNVPAVISLDQCWPIDKATRQPILDQDHPRYQQHVAKLRKIPETEFIDFRAEKGTWVFKVQHFSRYGLDYNDSDDENDEIDEAQMEAARQKLRRLKGEDDADDAPPAQSMASLVSNSNANVRYRAPGDSSDEWFPSADEEDSAMIMTVDEDSSVPEDTFQQTSTENRASFKVETEDEEQEEDDLGPFDGEDEMDVEEGYDMDESDFENRPPRSSSRSRDSATTNEIGAVLDISDPNWQPPKHSMTHPEYLRLEARRVQVMQATFFPPEEKKPAVVPRSRGVAIAVSALGKRTQTAITVPESDDEVEEDEARSSFVTAPLLRRPTGIVGRPPRKYARIGFSDSLLYNKNSNVVDAGLMMGRSFRVGWGKGGILVHAGKVVGVSATSNVLTSPKSQAYTGIPAKVFFEKVKIFADDDEEVQKERHRATLEVQLSQTQIEQDEHGAPYVFFVNDTDFSPYAAAITLGPAKNIFCAHETLIWKLGQSLFDAIPTVAEDTLSLQMKHKIQDMNRKAAFTAWLQEAVQPAVQANLQREMASGNPAAMVFTYLTGHQIAKACQSAIRNRDFKLATLVAQAGGEQSFRLHLHEQLRTWKEYRFEGAIGREYRRLYELLGGNVEMASGTVGAVDPSERSETFSVSEGLDWKRTLGLYLWYAMFAETPLEESFKMYEQALRGAEEGTDLQVAIPRPWYLEEDRDSRDVRAIKYLWNMSTENGDGKKEHRRRDILFHMIKLYTEKTHSLEKALAPRGITPSPLDYRVTWHLYLLFAKVLRVRDFADRLEVVEDVLDDDESLTPDTVMTSQTGWSATADSLTVSLAFQLETLGMWEWAVFVLLYLEGADSRAVAIKDMVSRNLPLEPKTEAENQTQQFLLEKLKLPQHWIWEAKAQRAQYMDDVQKQTDYLLKAGQHNDAHKIIVERLAPEMILHGELDDLHKLLEQISHDQVKGWHLGGEVYHDYIDCMRQMPGVWQEARELGIPTESLYALRRRLQRLLNSLGNMRRNGIRIEVSVCVAHMASQVSELLRDMSEQADENDVLTTLPLPEDQRLVRLHQMSHDYFTNLIKQESY